METLTIVYFYHIWKTSQFAPPFCQICGRAVSDVSVRYWRPSRNKELSKLSVMLLLSLILFLVYYSAVSDTPELMFTSTVYACLIYGFPKLPTKAQMPLYFTLLVLMSLIMDNSQLLIFHLLHILLPKTHHKYQIYVLWYYVVFYTLFFSGYGLMVLLLLFTVVSEW